MLLPRARASPGHLRGAQTTDTSEAEGARAPLFPGRKDGEGRRRIRRGLQRKGLRKDGTLGPGHVGGLRLGRRWEEMMMPGRRTSAWLRTLLDQCSGLQAHKNA